MTCLQELGIFAKSCVLSCGTKQRRSRLYVTRNPAVSLQQQPSVTHRLQGVELRHVSGERSWGIRSQLMDRRSGALVMDFRCGAMRHLCFWRDLRVVTFAQD